jgi:hypothetical protein
MNEKLVFWGKFIEVAYKMYKPDVINPTEPSYFPDGWKLSKNIIAKAGIDLYAEEEFIGFVAESTVEPNQFAVIFHGSKSIFDFLTDFEFNLVDFNLIKNAGKTEYGFTKLYESFRFVDPLTNEAITLLDYVKNLSKDVSFVVTGHSLGGSLATFHAVFLADRGLSVESITFASPMVGDATFVKTYNELVSKSTRIVNKPDIVPKLPGILLGYEHVNTLVEINSLRYSKIKYSIKSFHSLDTYIYCLKKRR